MNYTKEQLEMMSAEDLDTIIGGGAVDMSKYEKKADDAWMPKPHVAAAGDFAGQGEMGIADTAANMVEQTGQDASDSTAANFLTNTANALSGNLIPNVRKKSLQTLARGFYEDADGKRRYLEWSPEEQDYLLDKAMSDGWTGLARAAGSATGGLFGGKAIGGNALMKEWEDGEGKKYERGSTEWSMARLKHAQKLASMMLGDTVATEQNAQTEAAERGSTAAANIVAKGAPNLAYTAAYLSPWGIALNTALGAAGKAEGLQTDAMAYDEDGNLVTTAKGDTAGTAWLKGSASSLAEMGSELVGGKIGGAVVGRALRPLKNAAGRAVGSTAAGRSVLRFGDRIGNLFERTSRRAHLENPFEENLEELETAWFDALLGTDKRDSELKGTNPLGRFADATKEFFTPKNLLELNEAMLLTMGAGAFVAAATDRGEYRASRGTLATGRGEAEAQMSGKRVDDIIRAHELLTEEQMKDATTEEKTAALNAWIQGLSEDEIRQKIDAATGLVDRLANRIEGRNKFADNVAAIAGEMENAQGKNRFSDLTLSSPEAGSFDFASVAGVPEKDDKGNAVTAYADPQSGVRVEESVDGDGDVRYRVRGANGAYVAGPGGKAYMTDAAEASAVADRAAREQNIRVLERADKENFVRSEIGRIGIPGKYEVKATMDEVKNLVPGIENDKDYDPNNPAVEIPAGSVLSDGTRTDAPFTVYVLDNIGTRDEATRKVIHEAGIHLMLDQAFENEDDRAKFLFGIDKRAIRYGVDYVARAYGKTADEVLDDPFLREEALAHSAEAATSTPTMLGKFVHAFREMARGMGAEIPLNDEELGVALREMRGKMFGSPEIGAVQAGIDERKETMRKLYEQGEADKAIAEGWAENQDDGVAGENAEGGELARMEEEQRRQNLAQHQRDVREREAEVRDEKQRRREKRSAEAIDAQAKANPNVPNEDQSKFDYRAKITVSPAPKEETKKMPIYSDMEYNGHKVKVGPLLRGGKEWGRLIELPDGNVILAQGAKSNRAALNQMRKALDRLLPNKNKSNSKEGPKTARSVNWGPSDFVEWVRSTKHRNPRYEDLDEYRAYVERKAEEAKAEKERAAKDKAHAERQKQIEDAFKWGEYGFVKWVRDTKGREPNEKDFYADLQEYEAYKANEEKSAMDAADEAAREAEHKRIKADIEHAFGERDKELRRERSHRAKRAAYKRSIRRFIEEHGNAYPALDYWLENGRKMISGADQEAQEALARYSSAERMFLAGFGNGGTGYDELLENFVNQYRNQETTNERHYDGDMTVEDILDQAISEWRKYQQWVKDGEKSAAEEELEGLEAADHDARRKLAAEDAQIKEYALDEIAAKEAWEKEYADAVGFIENEWNDAEEAKLSPENLAKCEIGINAIRIDHHDKVFYFAGWDAEDGILTLVDPDAEDGNRVYYRVTADGIQEAKANGQRNETGTADNRAGAADAGSEEGGGEEEAGKGKGGGFKLKSATAGEIAAEEKRNAERKETERRNDAPLKAGKGETGQSLLDLGGAEGEDLFNRTERTDDAKDEFAKIKDGAKDSEALSAAVEEKAKEYEREAENWEKREYKPTDRTVEVDGEERRVDELNEERRKKKVAELRGKADALRKALADDVKGAKDAAYRAWLKKYGLNDTEARRKEFDKKQNGKSNPAGAAASARRIPAGEGELTDAERAWLGKTEIGKVIVSNYDSSVGDDKDFAVRQLRRSIENNKDALGAPPVKADAKPSAAMDAKAANKVLGMDAALGDAELRRKMAAWDAHRDERPGFAQKADAAKAILAYRAAKGKADARSTEVAARPKPEAATAAKEEAENDGTPRSREGLADVLEASGEVGAEDVGRIVKSATDAEVSALFDAYDTDEVGAAAGEVLDAIARREAKADADAEAANAGGKKDGGAPSVPTDEGFAAWETGRDGKPMSFASEEERANARATFDGLVRRGRVDGKTGRSNVRWSRSGIYTGSAADYEKPSLIHVGTGEGSQVYGWGLYGSTRRGIAEHYASVAHGNNTVLGIRPHDRKALESRSEKLLRSFNVDDYVIQNVKSCVYEPDAKSFALAQLEDAGCNDSSEVHQALGNLFDEYRKSQYVYSKYVYEQTFFTNRAEGDESHLLSWYDPVSEENAKRIVSRVKVEFPNNGLLGKMTASEWMGMSGADAYKMIAEELQDPSYLASLGQGYRVKSPEQTASEFLARADIDGVKYPVDSYGGKDVKDGDKVGWNYVSFRDDNIRVDHKWVDGKQRWSKAAPARDMSGWEYDGNLPPTDGTMALLHEYNRNPDKDKGTLYENAMRWGKALGTVDEALAGLRNDRFDDGDREQAATKAVTAEEEKKVVGKYGTTEDFREAGYIMPNGKMLDMSGRKVGARNADGRRTVSHYDVADVVGKRMESLLNAGWIRIQPESGGINMTRLPDMAAMETLERFVESRNGEVTVEIFSPDGYYLASGSYEPGTSVARIDGDIWRYFKEGKKLGKGLQPNGEMRWSKAVTAEDDAAYAEAVARGDRATALRMVREAAAKAMPNFANDKDGLPKVINTLNPIDLPPEYSAWNSALPHDAAKEVASWETISKSPYSDSFYNANGISWNYKPDGSLRIADHWNFFSRGEKHCQTTYPIENGVWAMGRYDAKTGKYTIIKTWNRGSVDYFNKQINQRKQEIDLQDKRGYELRKEKIRKSHEETIDGLNKRIGKKIHSPIRNGILRGVGENEYGDVQITVEALPSHKIETFSGWQINDLIGMLERSGEINREDRYRFYDEKRTGNGVFLDLATGQTKSADITYDDAGKLIPLSERFNPAKSDIRWSKAADGVPADVREELHGITQERINYYRAKVGLPPLESKRRTLEEMGREGQGLFANRDLVNTIVDAVSKKPRALSEEETVAIDLANAELEQQYELTMAQVDEAMLRGNKADELRLRSEADALRDRIDKFGRALRDTGSVTGRALALRRLMVSRNLTLAGFTSECEALKGKALTDEEKKDVAAAYRAVRDAIAGKDGAVLRELTKRIRDAAASDVNAIVAELKRRGAKSVPADVDGKFKDAVKQLVAWNDVSGGILTGLQGAKDTVNGIIRYHVANGVGENLTGKAKYDAVMGATLGTVKQYLGGATMEELEQAVSGYGISRPLSLDETELAVRDMDLQAKRYRALADLLNRKLPKATGDRRTPTSDEVKRLDAEIREKANELKMQTGLSPEEMQKLVDKRLATLEKRLQDYRVMLMTENFKPKDKRAPRIMTPEIMAKEKEVAAAMKKVEERKRHYRAFNHPLNFRVGQNYASDWASMFLAAPRVFRTMLDLSATGAQGAALFVSHPVEGMKALGKSVAAFYSSKKADELQLAMDADPDWQEFQKFGGHAYSISDVALDAVPEEFRAADTSVKIGGKTYSLDTLPLGIGKAVRSSERSFGAFLNTMNLAMYKAMKNGGGWSDPAGPTDTQKRDLAEALNVASGYGYGREGKGWWDKVMSAAFWAPRYTVAGVKQAVGYEVWSPFLRGGKDERSFKDRAVASKQLAKEEARRLASMAAWTLLATLLFGKKDPEWIEEILDPRSSHFGNVRIGNREVSFLGPMKQWLTFMSRMVNGNTVKNGVEKKTSRMESVGRIVRGKMSPLFGLGWDLTSREDYIGDKIEWGRMKSGKNAEGKNAVGAVPHILESVGYPLSLNDVHEAIKEDGIANALLMAPFALTGFAKNAAPVNDYNLVTDSYGELSAKYRKAVKDDPRAARQMLKDNPELRDSRRIDDLMKYVRTFERQAKKYEDAGKPVPEYLTRRIEDYKRRAVEAVRKARQ